MDTGLLKARAVGWGVRAVVSLPAPVLRAAFGRPPAEAAGLAPDAWALARLGRLRGDGPELSVAQQRAQANAQGMPMSRHLAPEVTAQDRRAGDVPVRLYVPPDAPQQGPLLVWIHGGGWVFRSVETHDQALRFLCARSGVRIASIEYRLAPEHPFPAPLDDALAAWRAIHADPRAFGADPARIAVGGDSAGGNLAAAVALAGRDGDVPAPVWQLLLYPVTDVPGAHPSYETFADGFYLSAAGMRWYFEAYAGRDETAWQDPRVAVLRADLSGVAPAHVATALADPLRDEGEAYAEKLRTAGVPVTSGRHPLLHGFLNQTAGRSSRDAVAQLGGVVAAALG